MNVIDLLLILCVGVMGTILIIVNFRDPFRWVNLKGQQSEY